MIKYYFEIKKDCRHKEITKQSIIDKLNEIIKLAIEDVKITIELLSKRSQNALAAYWCLIVAVVKWSNEQGNSYTDKDFDEWFKKEAGLVEEVDMMPMWLMRYKNEIVKGGIIAEDPTASGSGKYCYFNPILGYDNLGKRYIKKTRSISNKGDVSRQEMELLLNTVLKFGAENDVPNCEIKGDKDKLLRFYDK